MQLQLTGHQLISCLQHLVNQDINIRLAASIESIAPYYCSVAMISMITNRKIHKKKIMEMYVNFRFWANCKDTFWGEKDICRGGIRMYEFAGFFSLQSVILIRSKWHFHSHV